ncbi:hypothetical protein BO70DRAFT_366936 [Aspergillus heteromorphus CBS 117.55]|uniref:Shugoshin C-terminal domain-containing protein n=1 Tax=Aspergillus heteromorphus CBS 117.55 TaxID=1448321 RepID=A0A317UW56_9EURO|nr:uncharacterized protein BO70DRAFT_366936 [Aspergillus heteromorphus CBS 117.55]PWY64712.1 hypothetical protein BO70DRAFT_366936 [Aspergillus heteromorphus CBS 117.55]
MARLNELTASAEPIEALKRRFVRQNREIARVNSIQSLRIRSLESEVSHFLSENVSLREQVINLTREVERYEAVKSFKDEVHDIKAKLDNKLLEFNSLLTELGTLPLRLCNKFDETPVLAEQKQPTQSILDWRSKPINCVTSPTNNEAGRLPVILEGKLYPRKTLEPQELQVTIENGPEAFSPSNQENPVVFQLNVGDDGPYRVQPQDSECPERMGFGAQISDRGGIPPRPTLETRARKMHGDMSIGLATDSESSLEDHEPEVKFNPGTKRKLSMKHEEDSESTFTQEESYQTNQQSSPLSAAVEECSSPCVEVSLSEGKIQPSKDVLRTYRRAKRKVLDDKNTNISMSSPKKGHTAEMQEPIYEIPATAQTKVMGRKGMSFQSQPKVGIDHAECMVSRQHPVKGLRETEESSGETTGESKTLETEPEAPSPANHTSQDVSKTTVDVFTSTSRPTRRQRAIVSYAEPNLRDKMRRPTNNFIAAVEDRPRRTSSSRRALSDATDDENGWMMNTQTPRNSDCADKDPNSVSTNALSSSSMQQNNMVSQRKRKTSSTSRCVDLSRRITAETTGEDSAVWVASGTANGSSYGRSMGDNDKREAKTSLVLGHQTSSPLTSTCKAARTSRQPRRHSSNPDSSEQAILHPLKDATVGLENSHDSPSEVCAEVAFQKPANNVLQPYSHMPGPAEDYRAHLNSADAGESRRGRRAAARRKSMML